MNWLEGLGCGWRKEIWDCERSQKKPTSLQARWAERWTGIWVSQHEGIWGRLCGVAGRACGIHPEVKNAGASLKLGCLVSPARYPETQIFNLGDALEMQHGRWQRSSHVEEGCGHSGREKTSRVSDTVLGSWRFGEKGLQDQLSWETRVTWTCELWKQRRQMKHPEQTKLPRGGAVQFSGSIFPLISYTASLSHPSTREGLEGFYNTRKYNKK